MMSQTSLRVAARNGLGAAAAAALLSACSLFSSTPPAKPAALETIAAPIAGRVVWNSQVDSLAFPLSVAVAGERFIVAGGDGTVQALQADTGAVQWRSEALGRLSAGVGSDGRFAAVVTRGNELIVLDAGKTLWRKALTVPVFAAPLVAGERVFVLTVDRAVQAFDALDGRRLWELRRPGEPLTLAQPGVIAAYKDTLVVGQGPRMAGVDPLRGTLRWEANVATPRGTNEVERLADLVAPLYRQGTTLCARAFQSAVGCVNAERGSALWSRNNAGLTGLAGDADHVYGADASDRLTAWKLGNGDIVWTAEQFTNRKLSAPLAVGNTVAFGDMEGYVHFVARDSGKTVLRLATDGSPIVSAPVAIGTTILVATKKGGLYALRPQ
jgi:outer membrane assembly lipoprotein YfgL